MAIRIAIKHKTVYKYDRPVNIAPHIFRLRPAAHSRTPIEGYSLQIEPKNHYINWQQDPFGNYQARVVFLEPATALSINVEVIAKMVVINPFDFFVEDYSEKYPFVYSNALSKELLPYLEIEENGELLKNWIATLDLTPKLIVDFLVYINQKLNNQINYTVRMEAGVQSCEHTLQSQWGSCRDSAWLLVQILRHLGLAARFVSGYLVQLTADIASLDGPSGPAKDFTDLHAWTEVYIPGAGWIGLDPTSGLFASEGHIPLSCTPHYASAAPVVGMTDNCNVTFEFENIVSRIHEDPRVTKPYTAAQWAEMDDLGNYVDKKLLAGDVRLTMGGEPTFVSIDDMESAQWNTVADGEEKRDLSHNLIFRLRDKIGSGGMLHYGMGKWYPAEPLPRWQYGLFWRKDGLPLWKNLDLFPKETLNTIEYSEKDAANFMLELSKFLAVPSLCSSPVYEDAFYFLWSEGKLPINVDPLKADLLDSTERKTIAHLLDKGLQLPAGYILPIQWNYWSNSWQSIPWKIAREKVFLVPGNSPLGLRLPLNSLPKISKKDERQKVERDLFEKVEALGLFEKTINDRYGTETIHNDPIPQYPKLDLSTLSGKALKQLEEENKKKAKEPPESKPIYEVPTIRTTLCIESRNGILYAFLPPCDYIEHYIDLITSIEATSEKLQLPIRIEGYEPPRDNRIERLVVSPDPGVIEVNIHPSKSWNELKTNIDILYEEARLARLGTEKFMLDGRHTGTGGGNHITIGGAIPADSPILRRPDILQSLITYWQHHPGLSYLFSGAFIGPTSQAPRFDEGREERLYEMEIAFSQVPEEGDIPFWLVDRIFRHLLTDITGNTHRAELCIDKLFSPDSASGRLGILEFRAFDMPPHKEMSLLQMLLIRTLIAWFWEKPYKHDLVRWGTELHDKFMLSHYVRQDMQEVVDDLNKAGFAFKLEWFDPYFEFRFPHYGSIQVQGVEVEIRMAIEPWHVLGEEMSSSGTARFVDSSLERVQVKISNYNDGRYALLCNGCRVPLKPTQIKGEYVCGIRYRAWQPSSALHPTIGIDTPLVFDLVDTWNGRSIGGCTYHVVHPGGRGYDTFPVNSYEAESRRTSRFNDFGHTQDILTPTIQNSNTTQQHFLVNDRESIIMDAPKIDVNKDYPCTLDIRKHWKKGKR